MVRFLKNVIAVMKALFTKSSVHPETVCCQKSGLQVTRAPANIRHSWSCPIPSPLSLGYNRKESTILVTDYDKHVHVVTLDGHIANVLALPAKCVSIETSYHPNDGTILIGNADYKLYVTNEEGKLVWRYPKWLPVFGIHEVHVGDINLDGYDEITLGRGSGGLLALTIKGTLLWKIPNIRTWSHAIISSCSQRDILIVATEASGKILMYDSQGRLVRTLRPEGEYFTDIAAMMMNTPDGVQIAAMAIREQAAHAVVAFDLDGRVVWKTPVTRLLTNRAFACDDMNGDGIPEWVFIEQPDEFVFVSPHGEKLASLPGQHDIRDFLIVPQPDGYGMFITLQTGMIHMYQFEKHDTSLV